MSSRFLITCWPFPGHVFPQMSIALALRERGHEVAFYTGATSRELIEREGFQVFAFERVDEHAAASAIRDVEISAGSSGRAGAGVVQRTFRTWLVDTIPEQVEDLTPLVASWRPDVLVTDLSMWAPIVVLWERLGMPVALSSTFMGPLTLSRDAPPPGFGLPSPRGLSGRAAVGAARRVSDVVGKRLRGRVDELRATYGLGRMGCTVNSFTSRLPLYLVGNIPELDYGRRDIPPSVHYVGPCLWHPPGTPESSAWLDGLPHARPWVHVTESTLQAGDPFVLRAAARGLAGEPVELVGTTGGASDPARLRPGASAANIHLTRWVSHAELMPRCAAVVTTGGPNTIITAIRAGVPLVVVPTTWDKPDNAQRVVEAGVGIRIAPRRCTPESLRAAVLKVLAEPRYRDAAERLAGRLAASPGPAAAAWRLEELAATGGARSHWAVAQAAAPDGVPDERFSRS